MMNTKFFLMVMCVVSVHVGRAQDRDIVQLTQYMSGSFSTEKQAHRDSTFPHVHMHMTRIWADRTDGVWIYGEQSSPTVPATTIRQRIYRLHRNEDRVLECAVYSLPEPRKFVGAWNDSTKFAALTPERLKLKDGCQIYLHEINEHYEGATEGMACTGDVSGTAFTSAEIKIYADAIIWWEKGFNSAGEQVWGSTKGSSIFLRTP